MKLIRHGLVAAAVGAAMVLPATAAHAAPQARTVTVTSFSGQGLSIDNNTEDPAFRYRFTGPQASLGKGSVQFEAADPEVNPRAKMFIKREERIGVKDFRSAAFDYYFASDSKVKNPNQFYMNIYVDIPSITNTPQNWYDCKFDYVATAPADGGWQTLTVTATEAADATASKTNVTCPSSVAQMSADDQVFTIAFNAGDTSANDNGMKGGFDKIVVETVDRKTTYDLEPAGGGTPTDGCDGTGLNAVTGSGRNESLNGTNQADAIDLKGGNDTSDARGGDDCVLGGDGNDSITAGAGADEVEGGRGNDTLNGDGGDDTLAGDVGNDFINGGAGADTITGGDGNDQINPGAGEDKVLAGAGNDIVQARDGQRDTVDCGAGNDQAIADSNDVLTSCEFPR